MVDETNEERDREGFTGLITLDYKVCSVSGHVVM